MTATALFVVVPVLAVLALLAIGELFGKKKTWNF